MSLSGQEDMVQPMNIRETTLRRWPVRNGLNRVGRSERSRKMISAAATAFLLIGQHVSAEVPERSQSFRDGVTDWPGG